MKESDGEPRNPIEQGDLDVAASPFLAMGILYALAGLLGLGLRLAMEVTDRGLVLPLGVLLYGTALVLVGMGFTRRWRFTLLPAVPLCALGLLQFPLGTILFGWAAYAMWARRSQFYPFDRLNRQPEVP
jgi:hypothetical protein